MPKLTHCPHCGKPLNQPGYLSRGWGAFKQRRRSILQNTAALAPWEPQTSPVGPRGGFVEASRQVPARPQNLESDFLTPLAQSFATGGIVFLCGGYIAAMTDGIWWYHGLGAGILAGSVYWVMAMGWNRRLLWVVEEITRTDIDNDGYAGEPEQMQSTAEPVKLEVIYKESTGYHRWLNLELPNGVSQDDLLTFARGVVNGKSLAESVWTGKGKLFSKPKYNQLLDSLTQAGIVRWKNEAAPAQGRELVGQQGRLALLKLVYGDENARKHTQASNGNGFQESDDEREER